MCLSHVQSRLLVAVLSFTLATPLQSLCGDTRHNKPQSYPSGLSWVMQAMAALTGGNPVNSVTQTGSVTWTVGNNQGIGEYYLAIVRKHRKPIPDLDQRRKFFGDA